MKIILIIFLVSCSLFSLGQKTKTVEIVKRLANQEYVDALYVLNDKDQVEDTIIKFSCQNSKYTYIVAPITLFKGSSKEFYVYLMNLEEFYAKNLSEVEGGARITGEVNDQKVNMYKISFVLGIDVCTEEGYHSFTIKWIKKIKSQFVDWCRKNKVAYE